MDSEIHNLEQIAYGAVLRAFKAPSDALTWGKEGLITELRKELRISNNEHRELVTNFNVDDLIHRIREWRREEGGNGNVNLEQIAYGAILRAFRVQSDALTSEKEGLITELRHELRVSNDEHRRVVTDVNADDLVRRIRAAKGYRTL